MSVKQIFLRFNLGFLILLLSSISSANEKIPLKLGIMSFTQGSSFTTHVAEEDRILSEIPQILQSHLPDYHIETRFLRMNELIDAIRDKKVDIFLGSSGLYWQMKKYGVRDIATLISASAPNPNKGVAGIIFARKDDKSINSLKDAKGKIASTGLENMFLASQLSFAEIAKNGFDVDHFFTHVFRHDLPVKNTINMVKDGKADVGILRSCVLESELPDWQKYFKVIGEKKSPDFSCARSTDLYPNWTIAATAGAKPEVIKKISLALLSQPPLGINKLSWSLATDLDKVDNVSKLLKTGAYGLLKEWTFKRIWDEYRTILMIIVILIGAFLFHVYRVERLVTKRTQELSDEVNSRKKIEIEMRKVEERLCALHKLSVVSQLSTLFAHELKQPLAVIQYLTDAMKLLLVKDEPDKEKLLVCREKIESQVHKIVAVIDQVRSYAKSKQDRTEKIVLDEMLKKLIERNSLSASFHLNISGKNFVITGNNLEIELLLENLFKNAIQASPDSEFINVSLSQEEKEHNIILAVSNKGKKISESELSEIITPLKTSRKGGLGLGVTIIQSIAKAHGAQLSFKPNEEGGLSIIIKFKERK